MISAVPGASADPNVAFVQSAVTTGTAPDGPVSDALTSLGCPLYPPFGATPNA